jgi:hypothetical protein
MNQDNERLYPDSDIDEMDDINIDDININDNIDNNIENNVDPDDELNKALQASLQEYNDSQKRIYDAYNNIIATSDEYLKSAILENLLPNELEYVLIMVEKYYKNLENRILIEQQQKEYEDTLKHDSENINKVEDIMEDIMEDKVENKVETSVIVEDKKLNIEELRLERLKFFYKK